MITAQVEDWLTIVDELKPLLDVHWRKLALNQDTVPLSPVWDEYAVRAANGKVCFISLRDAGRMVGYWIEFIAPGLHYSTCLTATMDIWNVLPEYERTKAPIILMKAVEAEHRRRGIMRSFVGEKLHRPCGKLYRKFGYVPVETYYSRMYP